MHRKWWNLIRIRTIETGAEPGGGEPPQPEPPQSDPQANTGGEGDEKLGEHGMTALQERAPGQQVAARTARRRERQNQRVRGSRQDRRGKGQREDRQPGEVQHRQCREGTAIRSRRRQAIAEGLGGTSAGIHSRGAGSRCGQPAEARQLQNKPNVKPDPSQGKGGDPKPHSLSEAISAYYK